MDNLVVMRMRETMPSLRSRMWGVFQLREE